MSDRDVAKGEGFEPLELTGGVVGRPRKPAVRLRPSFRKPPLEADQRTFEPERPEDLVPEVHWVRSVVRLVEGLDLTGLVATYELAGHPPYPPGRLLSVWLVGMMLGVRSTRRLADAVRYDTRLVVAAKRMTPSYRTLGRFRVRLGGSLAGFLAATVELGLREGLIDGCDVGIDGTKMLGNTRQGLARRVRKFVDGALDETAANDEADGTAKEFEDEEPPVGGFGGADGDAKRLRTRDGHVTGYNSQAAVDMGTGMAVGGAVSVEASDSACLAEPLAAAVSNLGGRAKTLTTDKGYDSAENLALMEAAGLEPFVPGRERYEGEVASAQVVDGKVRCPHGYELVLVQRFVSGGKRRVRWAFVECEMCGETRTMPEGVDPAVRVRRAHRMRTLEAVRLLRLRNRVVERLFGCLKWNRGCVRFLLRGLKKVNLEWLLMLLVHNVAALVRHGIAGRSGSPAFTRRSMANPTARAAGKALRRAVARRQEALADPRRRIATDAQ